MVAAKWGQNQWPSFYELINGESGFNPKAINPSSGACGIGQFVPCNKYGTGRLSDKPITVQVEETMKYIANRYKTPQEALHFKKYVSITIPIKLKNGKVTYSHWY